MNQELYDFYCEEISNALLELGDISHLQQDISKSHYYKNDLGEVIGYRQYRHGFNERIVLTDMPNGSEIVRTYDDKKIKEVYGVRYEDNDVCVYRSLIINDIYINVAKTSYDKKYYIISSNVDTTGLSDILNEDNALAMDMLYIYLKDPVLRKRS